MFKIGEIAFGDTVRIVDTELTRHRGYADVTGVCYGWTTPSVTGVDVVGEAVDDLAFNVHFDADEVVDAWFAPDLVLLVDRGVGSQARVGTRSFVKDTDGSWIEGPQQDQRQSSKRRWFKRS